MARGIISRGDILTTTSDGVDLNRVWDEFQTTLSLANTNRNLIASLFTFDTTLKADAISLDGDDMSFEAASEFGIAKTGQAEPEKIIVGFPLEWYDLRITFTEKFLMDANRSQVDAQHAAALEANNRLLFTSTLRALMTKTALGSRPVNEQGVDIFSLYDGSTDSKPPAFGGKTFTSGHSHYLVSGAATIDGQDLSDLIDHVTEHGYAVNGSERIVILVHPDQGKTIRSFRVGSTSPYDFIPSESAPAFLSNEFVIGDKPPAIFNGLPILGSYGPALVAESYYVPTGYVIAAATSGANSSRNPLGFRTHERTEYRGLRMIPGTERVPLVGSTYAQGFGLGVRNRGAAAVMQIKASGTYDNPSL